MDIKMRIYGKDGDYQYSKSIKLNEGEVIDALERYLISENYVSEDELKRYDSNIEDIYNI